MSYLFKDKSIFLDRKLFYSRFRLLTCISLMYTVFFAHSVQSKDTQIKFSDDKRDASACAVFSVEQRQFVAQGMLTGDITLLEVLGDNLTVHKTFKPDIQNGKTSKQILKNLPKLEAQGNTLVAAFPEGELYVWSMTLVDSQRGDDTVAGEVIATAEDTVKSNLKELNCDNPSIYKLPKGEKIQTFSLAGWNIAVGTDAKKIIILNQNKMFEEPQNSTWEELQTLKFDDGFFLLKMFKVEGMLYLAVALKQKMEMYSCEFSEFKKCKSECDFYQHSLASQVHSMEYFEKGGFLAIGLSKAKSKLYSRINVFKHNDKKWGDKKWEPQNNYLFSQHPPYSLVSNGVMIACASTGKIRVRGMYTNKLVKGKSIKGSKIRSIHMLPTKPNEQVQNLRVVISSHNSTKVKRLELP